MFQFLLSLSYDGGNYHGWVKQKKVASIQSTFNHTLTKVIKSQNFQTSGASKTDAGVHACDQKVLLTLGFVPDNLTRFLTALNRALPSDIQINSGQRVEKGFSFPSQVQQKTYLYTINNGAWDFMTNRYEWHYTRQKLEQKNLQSCCDLFLGTHDFTNFCGLKKAELKKINPVRTIESFRVHQVGTRFVFEIKAAGFLRYQIRLLVGAIIKVCERKKFQKADIKELLTNLEVKKIPFVAPSQGLLLKEIILKSSGMC